MPATTSPLGMPAVELREEASTGTVAVYSDSGIWQGVEWVVAARATSETSANVVVKTPYHYGVAADVGVGVGRPERLVMEAQEIGAALLWSHLRAVMVKMGTFTTRQKWRHG